MACIEQFYVLGLPTHHPHEVVHAVKNVIKQKASGFSVNYVEGLVLYDASSFPGEREPLREGMQAVDLWTSNVTWLHSA